MKVKFYNKEAEVTGNFFITSSGEVVEKVCHTIESYRPVAFDEYVKKRPDIRWDIEY